MHKPFKAYADQNLKVSDGKMAGIIKWDGDRVIGRVVEFKYDDEARSIGVVAEILDDQVKEAITGGALTAISIAGKYARRWEDGDSVRYTPELTHIIMYDSP